MYKQKIWNWTKKIAYILTLAFCIERGWLLWFLLASTAIILLFYHKPIYRQMKSMGETFAEMIKDSIKQKK